MLEKICVICGKEFQTHIANKITCSSECSSKRAKNLKQARCGVKTHEKTCVICGKEFQTNQPTKKTCSPECRYQYNLNFMRENRRKKHETKTYEKICVICGNKFSTTFSKKITCSPECSKQRDDSLRKVRQGIKPLEKICDFKQKNLI